MNRTMIKKLDWDSTFFSKNIAEVNLNDNQPLELYDKSFDLIVLKQKIDSQIEIPHYLQVFKETKVIFQKELEKLNNGSYSDVKDTDTESREFSYFTYLAYESGKMSRFLLDKNFGEDQFKELYNLWVINSLNKQFAIKTFFIEEEGKAIGFVTLQQYNEIGKIGLIATHPDYQGKGIGRKLLEYAENFCVLNDIRKLEIPTQQENTGACSFYLRLGYSVQENIIIKHFWRND